MRARTDAEERGGKSNEIEDGDAGRGGGQTIRTVRIRTTSDAIKCRRRDLSLTPDRFHFTFGESSSSCAFSPPPNTMIRYATIASALVLSGFSPANGFVIPSVSCPGSFHCLLFGNSISFPLLLVFSQ